MVFENLNANNQSKLWNTVKITTKLWCLWC